MANSPEEARRATRARAGVLCGSNLDRKRGEFKESFVGRRAAGERAVIVRKRLPKRDGKTESTEGSDERKGEKGAERLRV